MIIISFILEGKKKRNTAISLTVKSSVKNYELQN